MTSESFRLTRGGVKTLTASILPHPSSFTKEKALFTSDVLMYSQVGVSKPLKFLITAMNA